MARDSEDSVPPPRAGATSHPAVVRLAFAAAIGLLVGVVVARFTGTGVAAVAGWDAGAFYLLASAWWWIARANADDTRRRAASDDPGRTLLFAIVLLASMFSMFANAVLLRHARSLPMHLQGLMVGLCLGAAGIAWLLTHTSFALRYAHLYYRGSDSECGGLDFPGRHAPSDLDFAYFAFTIGICFQTSDVAITSRLIRRTALGHALLSYAFNTIVFALALNFVLALLQ